MPDGTKLSEFAAGCQPNITGDEKCQAQILLNRLFKPLPTWRRSPKSPLRTILKW
jgi:hypothetical protein